MENQNVQAIQNIDLRLPWLTTSGTSNAQTNVMKEGKKNVNTALTIKSPGKYLLEPQDTTHYRNVPAVLERVFFILFHPETASLNKKTEIYQSCKHKQFKFLADCKVT